MLGVKLDDSVLYQKELLNSEVRGIFNPEERLEKTQKHPQPTFPLDEELTPVIPSDQLTNEDPETPEQPKTTDEPQSKFGRYPLPIIN